MAQINLSGLSLKELERLKSRVEKAIERMEKRNRDDALAAVRAKAKEFGFSLNDLTDTGASGKRPGAKGKGKSRGKVKYRDPSNSGNTWGGRGPRPAWLRAELEKGKSLEDFAV